MAGRDKDIKLIQKKLADPLNIYEKVIWKKNNINPNISQIQLFRLQSFGKLIIETFGIEKVN